jgi:hypothetical protein
MYRIVEVAVWENYEGPVLEPLEGDILRIHTSVGNDFEKLIFGLDPRLPSQIEGAALELWKDDSVPREFETMPDCVLIRKSFSL